MSSIKQHQEMGYDRTAGMFSPDGLLLQVEYAEKAVKLGASTLAITGKDGIVFIGDRKIASKLLVKDSFKKVFEIDTHILIAGSGVMSDGRRLIEQAQVIAQENSVKMQEPIDILSLVKDIANIQQYYSQAGGLRPFGVKLLFGGIDAGEIKLYETTPSGIYLRFLARSIGNLSDKINEALENEYKEGASIKDNMKLGLKLFKDAIGAEDFKLERFDVVSIDLNSNIKRYSLDDLKKL